MNAEIIRREQFWVLGKQETFTDENEDHKGLWERYMEFHDEVASLSVESGFYEVYFDADVEAEHALDCLAGTAVEAGCEVPSGLMLRAVPASDYAVFDCTIATIPETWGRIFGEWLKTSGFQEKAGGVNFDYYPPSCDSKSTVRLHLAIEETAD